MSRGRAKAEDAAGRDIAARTERAADTVRGLEEAIRKHQRLYDAGKPEISDAQFDQLVERLRVMAPKSKVLEHLGAPSTRKKGEHDWPMLSLEKVYEASGVHAWAKQFASEHFIVAPKYDGASLSLVYDEGMLVRALTRGNGKVGDDVTANARRVLSIPTDTGLRGTTVVRGELMIKKRDFAKFEEGRFANARNAVAGTLMRKVPALDVLSACTFIAYDVLGGSQQDALIDSLHLLEKLGFFTGDYRYTNAARLDDMLEDLTTKVQDKKFHYETDGLVVKVNNIKARLKAGATAHHPRWAIALKFQGESGETYLRSVQWQVSRNGTITPVGIVDPVELSGATVTRVTLHNLAQMEKLGLARDCKIEMTRRGGVIPQVERVVALQRGTPFKVPTKCPCCGEGTYRDNDFLKCSEPETCPDVQREKLLFWAQTTEMMGVGPEVIAKLYNDGLVMQPCEFYTLDRNVMEQLFGKGLGPKLYKEIQSKASLDEPTFLAALGIDGIGKTQAEKFLSACSFDNAMHLLLNDAEDELIALLPDGFGPALTRNLLSFLSTRRGFIQDILEHVTLTKPKKSDVTTGPFAGKKIVFTGKLSDMEREEARALVRTLGAETPNSVTKATDILVVGDAAKDEQRSKRDKADDYNRKGAKIEVIDEAEFVKRLAEAMAAVNS